MHCNPQFIHNFTKAKVKLFTFICTEVSDNRAARRQTSREWLRQVEEPELEFDDLGIELEAQDGEVLAPACTLHREWRMCILLMACRIVNVHRMLF